MKPANQPESGPTRLTDPILAELGFEANSTRRLLEAVPEDQLTWRPHEKAMSLGQLAMHVAMLPGIVAEVASVDSTTLPEQDLPEAASRDALLRALDESLTVARRYLTDMDDNRALASWNLVRQDGTEVMSLARIGVLRSFMLTHWYHHRGQLSSYLRQVGAEVPSVYGPTSDENPFA